MEDRVDCLYALLDTNVAILENMTFPSPKTRLFLPQCHILSQKACHAKELHAIWHTAKHFGTHFVLYFAKAESASIQKTETNKIKK